MITPKRVIIVLALLIGLLVCKSVVEYEKRWTPKQLSVINVDSSLWGDVIHM